MTRLFTLLFVALCFSYGTYAQKKALHIPVSNYPEHHFESIAAGNQSVPDMVAPERNGQLEPSIANTRGGGAIWSEDFGNGWPTGWVADDASGLCPWKWTTNGSHGYFNNSNATDYADPINSTTAGNGFLISDTDSANHFNFGQPSGTTYQYLDTYFATSEIDLGASYNSLLLEFEQSFRFNNSVDLVVEVSADTTNWTEYTVQGGVDNNTASADPDLVSINISGAVGASQTLYLRIGWNARVYFWMIDDMRIVEGLADDLIAEKAYHGNVVEDWEYEITPVSQLTSKELGVVVTNNGGNVQTNVTCNYAIVFAGDTVDDGSFLVDNGTLTPADTDTGWFDTGYTPTEVGSYTVLYNISSDATDEEPANNDLSRVFEVSEYEWSHEREGLWDGQYGGYIVPDSDPQELEEYSHGSLFFPVADAELTAVRVSFGSLTSASSNSPLALTVEVHEVGQNIQDIVDSEIEGVDIEDDGWQTFVLDDPLFLDAGTGYILAVTTPGGEDIMTIDGWGEDEDFGSANYGPFGTGGAINWYNGWGFSSAIRAVFDPTVGINETEAAQDVFRMYPNPANENVRLNFESNEVREITLTDATGKLVGVYPVATGSTNHQIDVSDLARGVYFLSVLTDSALVSEKLIVE